jgi:hypothetical protein
MLTRSQRLVEWYYCWHYRIVERHVSHWWRAMARHWRAIKARLPRVSEMDEPQGQKENSRMKDMEDVAVVPAMLGHVLLAKLDPQSAEALRAAIREEDRDAAKAEAFELAMQEVAERLEREREQLRDEGAQYKDQLDTEFEDELDRRTQQIRREVREDLEERLEALQGELAAATAGCDRASDLLVMVVKQLFPHKRTYLYDAGIRELPLANLNYWLAPLGLTITAQYRASARQVRCQLANGHWAQRTVFSLVPAHEAGEEPSATVALPAHQESPS